MATAAETCGFCFNEPVFGFCENCSVRLGRKCFELHKNAPGHITFQLDTSKKLACGSLLREKDIHEQKCSLHVTENLSLYCEKHDAAVCGRCIRSNHMTCKDSIVDLHDITFDERRAIERISTLNNLEQEICTIEKHVEENMKSNDECKETYMNAIEKYYKELLTRLDQLVFQSKNAGKNRYAQNEENLKKIQNKCKETKRNIQEQTNTVQELSRKNQQRHLYIISKRLEKELQNLNAVIRQSSLENTIVKFSFERNSKLQTLLQNTIQEIGTLQEACEGSDELLDQPFDDQKEDAMQHEIKVSTQAEKVSRQKEDNSSKQGTRQFAEYKQNTTEQNNTQAVEKEYRQRKNTRQFAEYKQNRTEQNNTQAVEKESRQKENVRVKQGTRQFAEYKQAVDVMPMELEMIPPAQEERNEKWPSYVEKDAVKTKTYISSDIEYMTKDCKEDGNEYWPSYVEKDAVKSDIEYMTKDCKEDANEYWPSYVEKDAV